MSNLVKRIALVVVACLITSALARVESQLPNIVVILVDDLGYSDLGSYGGEIETPTLDRLAQNGVRFSQFYNTARCCPSRASLLTGLYQHQAGIGFMTYANWGKGYEGTLNEQCVTLGEALKNAGYTTFVSGKWHVAAHKNPPSHSLPANRGFDRSTVVRTHIDSYWKVLKGCDVYQDGRIVIPGDNDNLNLKNPYQPEKDFYTTDYFTDVALAYVDGALREREQPFFLYLAYNAPHFPLEAPDETIAKYEAKFDDPSWIAKYGRGWDEMREKKLVRQKALGLVAADQTLPEVNYFNNKKIMNGLQTGFEHNALPKWKDVPANIKREVLFRRAIYNAQVDNLDENIGRLTAKLKAAGVYDDTLILFMSDNGCSGEMGRFGTHFEGGRYDHTEARFEDGTYIPGGGKETQQWPYNDKLGGVGYKKSNYDRWKKESGWATSQGQCWGAYSNTPFRKFKKFVHEGGIATPFIAHWPKGITARGKIVSKQYFHFMDVMPTLLEVAGAEYPAVYQGKIRTPLEGVSMLPYMQDPAKKSDGRLLFWQHETHSAVRKGDWKIVTDNDRADRIPWELYNLANDRSETANVADEHPQVVKELSDEWHNFARRVHATPFPERRSLPAVLERVRIAEDGTGFVLAKSGANFVPWGFNFVGEFGRIVEEYWEEDWPGVEEDFRRMRAMGANVVRLHLQVGTYMKTAGEVDRDALDRLRRTLDLARQCGLYLDLTGLGCYHLEAVPPWFDELSEAERWEVQARFWGAIAETCAAHPAVFCYDLMNEPVVTKATDGQHPWLLGELEGFYFVQRISNDPKQRDSRTIAETWVRKMVQAIRKHDRDGLVTVGVIPWAQVWPNAKPLFYSPEVARHLDFVSVHFYPKKGEVEKTLAALAVYDIGKPLVVEETFPLSCSLEELDQFIEGAKDRVDGWISHYFGNSIEEHAIGAKPSGELTAEFLKYWQDKGAKIQASRKAAPLNDRI